jgi:hypothetical protein
MAECFCGCGRSVPRFPLGIRTINKRGKLVRERYDWAYAHVNEEGKHIGEFELPGEEGEGTWLDQGTTLMAILRTIVHGEVGNEIKDSVHAAEFAAREKSALDAAEAFSSDWLKKGHLVEHYAVQDAGAMPFGTWLRQGGGRS